MIRQNVRRAINWVRRRLPPPVLPVILMYHRVATPRFDPWELSVSPARFREQMQAIARHRTPVGIDELVHRLDEGSAAGTSVAVTFDDGYLDNFSEAKPVLEEYQVPATVFITTTAIDAKGDFWWEELAQMLMSTKRAVQGEMIAGNELVSIAVPSMDQDGPPRADWNADEPRNERERTYRILWEKLWHMSPEQRDLCMEQLRRICGWSPGVPEGPTMSREQVIALQSDLVAIGAHARIHHPLPLHEPVRRRVEIEGSLADCQSLASVPITGFAYPQGNLDAETKSMVRSAGYDWACSTHRAAVDLVRFDRYDLPRLAVGNWSGRKLLKEIGALRP